MAFGTILKNTVGDVARGIGYQVNPFDGGKSYKDRYAGTGTVQPAPKAPAAAKSNVPFKNNSGPSDYLKDIMANNNAQIASLMASLNARPKLAQFDMMANFRKAKSAAEKAQNPLYAQKLNNFLKKQAAKKATKQKEFTLTKGTIDQELSDTLGENQISRTRTAEDTANAIAKIDTTEGQFQNDEGESFDQQYRQAAEQLAAEGGSQTGLGRQASADMIRLRNVTSQRQLDEFQGQREAKQLFKTRTFEDLLRGDTQANTLAVNKTKAAQFDLDKYLEDLSFETKEFRDINEQARLEAILRDTENYKKSGVESFLQSLAGKGFSAEDIAYNRQVYA